MVGHRPLEASILVRIQVRQQKYCIITSMTTTNPWINFNGNAEEAFNFYKSVFGGEFTKVIRFKDLAGPEFQVAKNEANKIMQIILPINSTNMLVGNDVPEFMGKVSENENRSKIHVGADSKEEAERIFNGLSIGGQVEGPFGDSPWGTYAAMFRDKYGIEWIIEFNPNK
jgi:PhnB protein